MPKNINASLCVLPVGQFNNFKYNHTGYQEYIAYQGLRLSMALFSYKEQIQLLLNDRSKNLSHLYKSHSKGLFKSIWLLFSLKTQPKQELSFIFFLTGCALWDIVWCTDCFEKTFFVWNISLPKITMCKKCEIIYYRLSWLLSRSVRFTSAAYVHVPFPPTKSH